MSYKAADIPPHRTRCCGGPANTPLLHQPFDQLVGAGRWAPPRTLGTFPVRFPSPEDPGDTGWHIDDAPSRIRLGSHHEIARRLAPAGEEGLSLRELADNGFAETSHLPEVAATGAAGTVYLCHPFLVHAAQPHRGSRGETRLRVAARSTMVAPTADECNNARRLCMNLFPWC